MTKDKQKEIAVNIMQELDIYKPYIDAFKQKGIVTMFENFGGFWATEDNGEGELERKIREIETQYGYTVYAVTHEFSNIGETYSMLITGDDFEENYPFVIKDGSIFYVVAYVWNKSDEWCSEAGDIGVVSFGGGIRRSN